MVTKPKRKTHTSTAVKSRYNKKAYDRMLVTVKKGEKDRLKAIASGLGYSLNGYILHCIEVEQQARNSGITFGTSAIFVE